VTESTEHAERVRERISRLKAAAGIQGIGGDNVVMPVHEVEEVVAALESRLATAEGALREAGYLLFGTWDEDEPTYEERHRRAEAIFRAALTPPPSERKGAA
jgi:hypothetical protein